jgi:hypothetical protein
MKYLFITLIVAAFMFSCTEQVENPVTDGKGTLKLNVNFENTGKSASNARETIPQPVSSVYVRVTDNSVTYPDYSEYVTGVVWSGTVDLSNPVIELPVGDYKVYITTQQYSEDLTSALTGEQFNNSAFKIWKDVETTTVEEGKESVRDFWMYPFHSAVEFFLEEGAALPSEATKVEFEVRGWTMNFNTAMQRFTDLLFTDDNTWTEGNYGYSSVVIPSTTGERIVAPFVGTKSGQTLKSELIVRVYNGSTVIWTGSKSGLELEPGYKFKVYYTPETEIASGTIRISMFEWNGLEEVDVTLN